MDAIRLSVFTKPWPTMPLPALALKVRRLAVQGIELPVRPGYQVEPHTVTRDLPEAARALTNEGVHILSVAGEAERTMIEACGTAGVPMIRVMAPVAPGEGYTAAETRLKRMYRALEPVLRDQGVQVGIQNHCGSYVPNALGLRALLDDLDPACYCAVWDAAHEALAGMLPELALDVIGPRLGMVNLKNGYWYREDGAEQGAARWSTRWTSAKEGLADWPRVVRALQGRRYAGTVCLTAEYSDPTAVDRLIAEDTAYARELLALA